MFPRNYLKEGTYTIRPVTPNDKWCRIWYEGIRQGIAPWGYVVTIPMPKSYFEFSIEGFENGHILRTKKKGNNFLFQVLLTHIYHGSRTNRYFIDNRLVEFGGVKKYRGKVRVLRRHILNVRNER